MAIDDKAAAAWIEGDLQELCDEGRREGPQLDFKKELHLDTEGQKNEAEKDVLGMANGGGGHIIYGVDEASLADGSTGAARLTPLQDGSLYERLNNVLADRGEPRLPFVLYSINSNQAGIYLVVEIFPHQRPHMAQNSRYYIRRTTVVRPMTAAEVEDAYRERFRRQASEVQAEQQEPPDGSERRTPEVHAGKQDPGPDASVEGIPPSVLERIHRGLKPVELIRYLEEGGDPRGPGWMSVFLTPVPPQRNLIDPTAVPTPELQDLTIEPQWNPGEGPMRHFRLRPTVDGFKAQLPPRDDVAPGYLVHIWPDGVMEFGTTLEPALLHDDPDMNRVIATLSMAHYAHDYLLYFREVLRHVGYKGPVAAGIGFYNVRGHQLGVGQMRYFPNMRPIEADSVQGPFWQGDLDELSDQVGPVVRTAMNWVFLAGGIDTGCYFIDESGNLLEQ